MKKNVCCILLLIFAFSINSCSNDDEFPEKPQMWYEGTYEGTYKSTYHSEHTNDAFLKYYKNPIWNSCPAKVIVKNIGIDSMEIQIISSLYTDRVKGQMKTIDNYTIKCGKYTISDGEISSYEFNYGLYDNGWGGGWLQGSSLKAYKIE